MTALLALMILVIYDNTSARPELTADWGFAALVEHRGHRVLFDSGTKPELFRQNLERLKIDPRSIERVVISHAHNDHVGGLLGTADAVNSPVSFLDQFPPTLFSKASAAGLTVRRVTGPEEITPGIYTTGTIEGQPPEQSLVIETADGLVILTGCSHPGLVKIVETARRQRGKDVVRLVVGGFHMFQQDETTIRASIARLREMKVEAVAAAHCSGDLAKKLFLEEYGERAHKAGAGKRFALD